MLLASKPHFPAMLLALRPGLDAMLLGCCQVWADLLVCVKQEILHATRAPALVGLICLCVYEEPRICMQLNHSETNGEGKAALSRLDLHHYS